ncbi:hypothetical protein AYO49_01340 [Verrucomicrobiaceae bacterium SCGC AG-212-N21]|nr:hypothetical protein AYO49_01340 [Verrucomicrobiaceae bacterium SCGC AG-212-N21]
MKLADKPSRMLQRATLWAAPLLLAITVFVVPVTNSWMKVFQLGLLIATVLSWLVWLRRWRVMFFGGVAVLLVVAVLFCMPTSKETARNELPAAYADALQNYQGVIYWWGGESSRGIDCSGLIRRGMMDAALRQGLINADGEMLRAAADLWWHDCSADALGDGYRGYTVPITEAVSLNVLDHSQVRVGDLAIAGGGSHILAYLGDKRWIQADPTAQSVIAETAPAKNGWFKGRVKIVRWKWLDPAMSAP